MSYYDWQHLTKPWKIVPVEQDTVENTKALSITPVDDVTPQFMTLHIPSVFLDFTNLPPQSGQPVMMPCQMVGQFNYTVDNPFSLSNVGNISSPFYALCISWRTGGDVNGDGSADIVHRYVLGNDPSNDIFFLEYSWLPFPKYKGEGIPQNFVIEVWMKVLPYINMDTDDWVIQTGELYFAPDADMPTPQIEPLQFVTLDQLKTPLPENLNPNGTPVNPAGPWLTNP